MTASDELASARRELITRIYEATHNAFPDDNEAPEGTPFVSHGGVLAYRSNDSVIVRENGVYRFTVNGRQYIIESDPTPVSVGEARWPSDSLSSATRESIPILASLDVSENEIENIRQARTSLDEAISQLEPSRENIRQWILNQNIDAIESSTPATLPPTRTELEEGYGSFGDDSPPIARLFLYGTDDVSVEYEDADITLLTGTADGETWGLLIGVDDGGPFMHPMPRSLRLESPSYSVNREDIRDILGYEEKWTPDTSLETGVWYRVQGDMLMQYIETETLLKVYAERAVGIIIENLDQEEILEDVGLDPFIQEHISLVEKQGFRTALGVSVESTEDMTEQELRDDIDAMLGDETSFSDIDKAVEQAVFEAADVHERANDLLHDDVEGPTENLTFPIDNHVIFLSEGYEEPFGWRSARKLFDNDDRDRTYAYCPEDATMTIEHNEHDPITTQIPAGVYLFTLQRRRMQ